jgi:ubiquitin carboxyl-terminal hydrolase 10
LLISQPQPLPVCQSNSIEASQQLQIETLPPVLVLHLKRFLSDETVDGIIKTRKPVRFEPELEIPLGTIFSFVSLVLAESKKLPWFVCSEIMAPGSGISEPAHYKLCGVLYHHGEFASTGHYTVDVLCPKGDNGGGEAWLRIDKAVNTMQHEEVFGGHDNEQLLDANMLFYSRTDPI